MLQLFQPRFAQRTKIAFCLRRLFEGEPLAGKLRQHTITCCTYDSAMVPCDQGIDDLAVGREGTEGAFFIGAHEAAVAVDIGTENGGELALHVYPLPQAIILLAPPVRQAA